MDQAVLSALLSPLGWSLLSGLPPYDEADSLRISQRMRDEGHDPALISAALTQSRLRAAGQAKFGQFAHGMLFTPDGLEQATRLTVAARHAQRFRAAGCNHVIDLTSGIGADAMAFAALGLQVTAVEIDAVTAAIAATNLRHFPEVAILNEDALALDYVALRDEVGVDGIFADPARRSGGRRRHRPEDYQPSLTDVLALRDIIPNLGLKLGPAIDHDALPEDAEAQWVSIDGSVVELGLWHHDLATAPGHSALIMRTGPDGSVQTRSIAPRLRSRDAAVEAGPVADYLHEPDGAVIRAGLVDTAAEAVGGHLLDPTIAYITSDHLPADDAVPPLVTSYRILDVLPFDVKKLKAYLKERDVGTLTIKKRGADITPEQLRKQLGLRGSQAATIVVTRVAGAHRVLVADPLVSH